MSGKRIKSVVIVTDIPNPYRIPLFNELDRQLKDRNIAFKVIFGSDHQANRHFKIDLEDCHFDFEILNSSRVDLGYAENTIVTYKGLNARIKKINPDLTFVIGFTVATMKLWWRSWFGHRYSIWSGSLGSSGGKMALIRKIQRRLLINRSTSFIAYGTLAKEYLISQGAPAQKVFVAINSVDTRFFAQKTQESRSKRTPGDTIHLTFTGYLSPRKNAARILTVFALVVKEYPNLHLHLAGEGAQRADLEKQVSEKGWTDKVTFHGFVQPPDLPDLFAQTDVFLFQTDFDIWGLVLNEAMASGLPCLSSVKAGATHDLIIDQQNGIRVDFSDSEATATELKKLLDQPDWRKELGKNAAKFIAEKANLSVSANGFVEAIESL